MVVRSSSKISTPAANSKPKSDAIVVRGGRKSGHSNDDIPTPFEYKPGKWRVQKRGVDSNGVQRRFTATGNSKHEAVVNLFAKISGSDEANGSSILIGVSPSAPTIDDYLAIWLKKYEAKMKRGDRAFGSYETYKSVVKTALFPKYGLTGKRITDITARTLLDVREKYADDLGDSYRWKVHHVIKNLEEAVLDGIITHSPWIDGEREFVNGESSKELEYEREYIKSSIDFFPQSVVEALVGESLQTQIMIRLSLYGLRPAEIRGLRVQDYFLGGSEISIKGAEGANGKLKSTKTPAGVRNIRLFGDTARIMATYWMMEIKPKNLEPNARLFDTSKFRQRYYFKKVMDKVRDNLPEKLKFDEMRLYALRHVAATILATERFDSEVIRTIMGWDTKRPGIESTYIHEVEPQTDEALERLEEVISENPDEVIEIVKDKTMRERQLRLKVSLARKVEAEKAERELRKLDKLATEIASVKAKKKK